MAAGQSFHVDGHPTEFEERMSLGELLGRLRVVDGVDLAAIASTDGLLIESSARNGVDVEAICAVAANGLALSEALGREINKGSARQTVLEYDHGMVMIEPLNNDAMLLVLCQGGEQLGRLRFLVRKHRDAIVTALDAI